ncbi:MAG: T9SS type A sorting domain-containing protein [Bacteroidetes bacterium]|nr:T9SS type A sorting domain-containing protein [Bacteroidota bacterium]
MKKNFTLIFSLLMAIGTHAQVMLSENFSSGTFPPAGWTVSGQNTNWRISQTANAGGVAPEGRLNWSPQFNTLTRLISPAINLTGQTKVALRLKHKVDHYSSNFQIGVSTRANATATWNNVWTQTVTADIPAQERLIIIENSDVNSDAFQFSIFFSGNSYNIDDWWFDDFELFVPAQVDGGLASQNIPTYFFGEKTIQGTVINFGLDPITSYKVNWSLNDGEVFTTDVAGLNIATGQSHNFTAQQTLNPPAGDHVFKIWISHVNGQQPDGNPANDMITKNIGVATQSLQRRPLFEEFTSSTCAPCASFNNSIFNPFVNQNGQNIALIKYQMNWPGSGDPYYTAEGGVRRTYYAVNAVPMLFVEGKNVATSAAAVNTAYQAGMADPAFVKIEATHEIQGTFFNANVQITPYVNLNNATMHVVIVEKLTTGNVASNGETSFKHVMMKMWPNASGTTQNFAAGQTATFNISQNMAGTFVEEMNDLVAVVFLQDNSNKYVFQAAYTLDASQVAATVSFDPVAGSTGIPTNSQLHIHYNMPIAFIGGIPITNDNVAAIITLKQQNGPNFPFTATINDEKTTITVTPTGLLNSYTWYELSIEAVQNNYGVITPGASNNFETGMHVGIGEQFTTLAGIYPNPANDNITLRYYLSESSNVQIQILDLSGKLVQQIAHRTQAAGEHMQQINISQMPAGVYLVRMQTPTFVQTERLIVK